MQEIPFTEAIRTMSIDELLHRRRNYTKRRDNLSMIHSLAIKAELERRTR